MILREKNLELYVETVSITHNCSVCVVIPKSSVNQRRRKTLKFTFQYDNKNRE